MDRQARFGGQNAQDDAPEDVVTTSEELVDQVGAGGLEIGYAELAHAMKVDVIIALALAGADQQGGVYRELEILAPYDEPRNKVTVFLPNVNKWRSRFAEKGVERYSRGQKVFLDWSEFESCEATREISLEVVSDARKARMYAKLNAMLTTN